MRDVQLQRGGMEMAFDISVRVGLVLLTIVLAAIVRPRDDDPGSVL